MGQDALVRAAARESGDVDDVYEAEHGDAESYRLVAGEEVERPLADFERACLVHLEEEQAKIAPDSALVALLCDAVRLCRTVRRQSR